MVSVGGQNVVGHSVANERRHDLAARPVVEARGVALEAMPAKYRTYRLFPDGS